MEPIVGDNPTLPASRLRIRVGIIVGLLYFYSRWFVYDNYYSWLDNINLLIHEAGHPLMSIFGEFMQFFGGTFFQLLIPIVFLVSFFLRRANLAWQLCLFRVGQNFLNISIYAGDAFDQALPLLGGEHDRAYMLGHLGLLNHARSVETIIFVSGSLLIFSALGIMALDAKHRASIEIGLPS